MIRRKLFSVCALQSAWLAALLLLCSVAPAQAARRERLIDSWRPLHYEVSLKFDEKLSSITAARTEITIVVLRDGIATLDIDFGEMAIDSVLVEDAPARFERRGGLLLVSLTRAAKMGECVRVAVAYHGRPADGLILTADKDGKPSATGDNWPDRVHNWIPTLDHPSAKATVRFTVNAPARDLVVANGRLETTTVNTDTTRTWVWSEGQPISPYCMIVGVAEYAQLNPKGPTSGAPLTYYVPQSDRKYAMQGFAPAEPSVRFFSETVAPYPYEKLALIVGATRYGGMENSSAIVFGSTIFNNFESKPERSRLFGIPSSVRNVVAHEIAHQWFGDSVTESTWADLWLSEGFATYFAGLFIERAEGKTEFRAYMKAAALKYFGYEKESKSPIHDTETEDLNELLNPNNYEKGAWVLHMLRGVLGDKDFFQGIRDYYAAHTGATASTEDLRAALERASGMDLKEFFTRWVYQSGHPQYDVSWKWTAASRGSSEGVIELTVRQTQADAPFLMPLTLEVTTNAGARRTIIKPTGKTTTVRVPSRRPTSLSIDPDDMVLKEITEVRRV